MKKLTSAQRDQLIEQYVEVVVDNMSTESLVEYAQWKLAEYYDSLSDSEIKDSIDEYADELYDELVDNITSQPDTLLSTLKTDNLADINDNEADGITDDDIFIDINNTGGKY
jgi:hypothetical protein